MSACGRRSKPPRSRGPDIDLQITRADFDDAGEIITLQRAAFLRDAQLYGDPFLSSLTQTVQDLRSEMDKPECLMLVARLGARIVGSVRGYRHSRTLHIGRLMTAPDLEGRGVGTRLLAAIEAAEAQNVDTFELSTGSLSTPNIAMYARRGYVECGRSYPTPALEVVTMRKPVIAG